MNILIIYFKLLSYMIVILNKLKLEKISYNFNKIFHSHLFKYFKSNHLNRLNYIIELKSSKKKFSKNYNRKFNDIIFIGDSHVEMYSRSNKGNFLEFCPRCIWLGPCTILGTYFSQSQNEYITKIKHFYNLSNVDEIKHIIFSIGSIDVRTLFYQLLVAKSVDNEKSIFLEFEKAFSHFKENVIDKVKSDKKISIMKIYNSSKIGDSPKNIRDINIIKKKDAFATFGSSKKRQQWTNKINNIIRSKCKIYQFNFIDIDLGLGDNAIKKYSLDGIHINDIKIINKISELIHTK